LLAGDAERRTQAALALRRTPQPLDLAAARTAFTALLAGRMAPTGTLTS